MYPTLLLSLLLWRTVNCAYQEKNGHAYLRKLNKMVAEKANQMAEAEWEYQNNINEKNFQHKVFLSYQNCKLSKVRVLWVAVIKCYSLPLVWKSPTSRKFSGMKLLNIRGKPSKIRISEGNSKSLPCLEQRLCQIINTKRWEKNALFW